MKGYLDRIEDGGKAVIIVEEQGFEIILPLRNLPEGSRVHSWFRIIEGNGDFSFELDEDEQKRREQLANDLTSNLRMKSKNSKYKRQ
ncbi:DUF3006 domain-containing protein [Planococcus sp. X10-3]|uniref:DUF3006 domain-containing protein n=1 Tax=Planococcus sp. X10-3 TaxID=3061240 RepID=UPI003BAEFFCD